MKDIYSSPESKLEKEPEGKKPLSIVWVIISGFLFFILVVNMWIQISVKQLPPSTLHGSGALFGAFFFFTIFRYKSKNALWGILLGGVIGFSLVKLTAMYVYYAL